MTQSEWVEHLTKCHHHSSIEKVALSENVIVKAENMMVRQVLNDAVSANAQLQRAEKALYFVRVLLLKLLVLVEVIKRWHFLDDVPLPNSPKVSLKRLHSLTRLSNPKVDDKAMSSGIDGCVSSP